ncbi:MAG: (2Fe-2S)-binding protein [Desulfotomaculaceae bacterium]
MATTQMNLAHPTITLTVNGENHSFILGEGSHEVTPSHTLAHTLRERLGLTGTKVSCDDGACGCCTVQMDGKAVNSCLLLTVECEGKEITTIEGLGDPVTGTIDPLQKSFIDHTAFQCGFCTPGIIMSAKSLLTENPAPTRDEVKESLAGNFCRCNSHYHVLDAVMTVARKGGNK